MDLSSGMKLGQYMEIEVELIVPLSDNIRTMDAEEFNLLCQSIRDNGAVEPIEVVAYTDGEYKGKYRIVNGQHRFEAFTNVFSAKIVPCIIVGVGKTFTYRCKKCGEIWKSNIAMKCKKCNSEDVEVIETVGDWDDTKFWTEAIRLNNIKGKFDLIKLSDRVLKLRTDTEKMYDMDTLKRKLGFAGAKSDFERIFADVSKQLPPEMRKKLREVKGEINTIEDLSTILNILFKQYGKTIDSNFMSFSYGGGNVVMVKCDAKLWELVKQLEKEVTDKGLNMANELAILLGEKFGIRKD